MKFRKINDTTVNCIITQADMKEHGIDLDDLFERKKNAVEFIKGVIAKAVSSEKINLTSDYTAMRLSVLPDRSISLTISQGASAPGKISEGSDDLPTDRAAGNRGKESAAAGSRNAVSTKAYVYQFPYISDMLPCCRILASSRGLKSSVYYAEETGLYYLVLEKDVKSGSRFDSMILGVSEFGKMVSCDELTLSFLKEHSRCIIDKRAAEQIAEIYQ